MIRTKPIVLASAVLVGLLLIACGSPKAALDSTQSAPSDAERFSQQAGQTLQRIQASHELLNSDIDSMSMAEQDERFREVQDAIGDDMVTVQTMSVPEYLKDSQEQLTNLLLSEQHIWEHMAFYALSGEEAQWTEAKYEAIDVDLEAQRLTTESNRLLETQGVALTSLLPEFVLPSAPVVAAASDETPNTILPEPLDQIFETQPGEYPPNPKLDPPDIDIPDLTLTGGVGDIIIQRFQDRSKQPATLAHWSMDVDPGELMMVDYPFVSGDNLEISVFGHRLDLAYIEGPSGQRLLEIEDILRPWRGDLTAPEDGWYRVYLDNTQGDSVKNMHVIITHHDMAPDAVHLPDGVDKHQILLPQNGS